ncbi:site-specific integrase [Pedobacter sp. BS3]|uniref:site-specific integrase n=1 Tax=Pedobacter sp. BS3 TaxID=2567937 RepID=UPI0011EED66D|nr:site-specific integrase [Pedobacter sp. BS3]TZF83253.1 site-specific integrase [Pedobacter sp. BS3]
MADVNFYLRDNAAEKETGVMLFLSFYGKRVKIGTVEKINPKYWNAKKQRANKTGFPTHVEFNQRLENYEKSTLNIYRQYLNDNDGEQPRPDTIKEFIQAELFNKQQPEKTLHHTLVTYAEHFLNEIETGRRLTKTGKPLSSSIYKIYKTHLSVLKQFQAKRRKPILFEDVTQDFYYDFVKFLTNSRKYSNNTIGKHIRTLKAILKDASFAGINTRIDFTRFTAITEDVNNIYLNPQELETIFNLDLSQNPRLERVRDLFLVGCWTGLRFSDFSNINPKDIKGEFIEVKTQKTGKPVVIPIHPAITAIMKRYEGLTENSLPLPISNQKLNDYIKEVGELAGINETIQKERTTAGVKTVISTPKYELITTHTARRSFATNAYNMNVPTLTIMAITGHKTESNFMKYIKVTPKEHAEKLREIWHRQMLKVV